MPSLKKLGLAVLALTLCSTAAFFFKSHPRDLYQDREHDAKAIYRNMTLDEKFGQLIQPSYSLLAQAVSHHGVSCKYRINTPNSTATQIITACGLNQISHYHLGAVWASDDPFFATLSVANWSKFNALATRQHRLGTPSDPNFLIGTDLSLSATTFPSNIGLGVSHNPELLYQIGQVIGRNALKNGFTWVLTRNYDLHWQHTEESFGQPNASAKALVKAYIDGIQDIRTQILHGPIATAKPFIADSLNYSGSTAFAGFDGALEAHVGAIIVPYKAIPASFKQFKHQGLLGTDGVRHYFTGFTVTDWDERTATVSIDPKNPLTLGFAQTLAQTLNSGVDMFMFSANNRPNALAETVAALKSAYQQGLISDARLEDAVTHILAVKYAMQSANTESYALLQAKERTLALQAAQQSLVLFKNATATLPLKPTRIQHVIFIGTDDLSLQNKADTRINAESLERAIKAAVASGTQVYHQQDALPKTATANNSIVISMLSADSVPDNQRLALSFSQSDATAIQRYRHLGIPVVTIVYSRRPVILSASGLQSPLNNSDALIAAFSPGTQGGTALSNALFGTYHFKSIAKGENTLTSPWPKEQQSTGALFPIGYGLAD